MKTNHDAQNSIVRLQKLLTSRFGKQMSLKTLVTLDQAQHLEPVIAGTDFHIPLVVHQSHLATAVVPQAQDLSLEQLEQVSQMVKMILEPILYKEYLERIEANSHFQATDQSDFSNVYALHAPALPEIEDIENKSNRLKSSLAYFYDHDPLRLQKVAHLLHELTDQWASLPFRDVAEKIKTLDDLVELGQVTLILAPEDQLSMEHLQLIQDYLALPNSAREVLFVLCSHQSLEDHQTLPSDLKAKLAPFALELSRAPLTERGLRTTLQLLYF